MGGGEGAGPGRSSHTECNTYPCNSATKDDDDYDDAVVVVVEPFNVVPM